MIKSRTFRQTCKQNWWIIALFCLYIFSPPFLLVFVQFSLEDTLDVLAIFTGVLAIISLVFAAQQLKQSIEQGKINRSWDCLKLYMEPDCRKIISSVLTFLRLERITPEDKLNLLVSSQEELEDKVEKGVVGGDLLLKVARCLNLENQEINEIKNKIKKNEPIEEYALSYFFEFRSRVIFVQNLFEIMGTLYNKNQLNREIIKGFFKTISQKNYKRLENIIEAKRQKEKHTTMFEEWETMNKELQN